MKAGLSLASAMSMNVRIPMKYSIRNIPTLLFFKDGELVDRMVGAASKGDIAKKLDALL